MKCFNPRPPCEGRATLLLILKSTLNNVSIRAPPVKGGRLEAGNPYIWIEQFQSAPPL